MLVSFQRLFIFLNALSTADTVSLMSFAVWAAEKYHIPAVDYTWCPAVVNGISRLTLPA
jgi:hypothetical protein